MTATRSAWMLLVALGVVAANGTAAGQTDNMPRAIEVFTTVDLFPGSVTGTGSDSPAFRVEVQVYRLDGIERLESALSRDLPADLGSASRVALDRIQQLDRQTTEHLERSALGLAKTVQYGIDRVPAVVFDGEVVVYGVTDLRQALDHYRQWRARELR